MMNTVILYGSEKDTQVTNTLLGAITAIGKSALHVTYKAIAMVPPKAQSPDFLIIDQSDVPYVQTGRGVVVFRQGLSFFQNGFNIPENYFAVVDPENEEAVKMLRKSCMQTVTCGLSQKDTVTFSSIEQDSAVVSLQRGILRLDGKSIEPVEVPVRFGGSHAQYAVLSAVAVLLLSGCIGSETKIDFL